MTVNFRRGEEVDRLAARQGDVLRELDELRLEVAELRASRRRLVLTADAERRSIERELHDGVQQQLVGLAANLELLARSLDSDPATSKGLLADMRSDTELALEETRTLAHRIYPPMLEAGGLIAALRSAAASADVPASIDIARDQTYPPEIAGAMYFCCLDIFEKAAAGTTLAITAHDDEGALAFDIVVDGDVDAERSPLRDRIEAVGGRCTIESGAGRRTRVACSLPLSG
jgi:signal transduction histidine kinase